MGIPLAPYLEVRAAARDPKHLPAGVLYRDFIHGTGPQKFQVKAPAGDYEVLFLHPDETITNGAGAFGWHAQHRIPGGRVERERPGHQGRALARAAAEVDRAEAAGASHHGAPGAGGGATGRGAGAAAEHHAHGARDGGAAALSPGQSTGEVQNAGSEAGGAVCSRFRPKTSRRSGT